ncbi:MAG: HAMP domain-containing histidine kinase [Phycisphaerae bacterium]|nr:HAMP domain-containing histidine kinase [Phycisphaerae bacterium]
MASDDLVTRQAVSVILRRYDQPSTFVSTGREVLSACDKKAPPEKVILDVHAEMGDPISLFHRIFQTFGAEKTRVFLLTHDQDADATLPPGHCGAGKMFLGGLADLEAQFQPSATPLERFGQALSVDQIRLGSEDEFMAVFLHAPIPIYLIDPEGQVRRANRVKNPYVGSDGKSSRDIGYVLGCLHAQKEGRCGMASQCRNCLLSRIIRETLREDRNFHRKEISLEVSAEEESSENIHALVSTTPLWIDRKKMILLFLEDVSELRRSQELLAEFNRNLETLVARRTAEVQALLEQKKEFIRQLGHDLRTPLTPLVALLPKFREHLEDPRDREMLELIISNTDYIHQLVVRTLDLMVLENEGEQPELRMVELRVEANNVLADFAPVLKENGFTAVNNIEPPVRLPVDVVQFKELLLNLLSNAVKFSPAGGRILIGANYNEKETTLSVSDTGVGMTPEQLSRVFDEFYKADPSRHDRGSLGLGLSICKRIVNNHGGRIWVESPGLGKGTTVFITLPSHAPDAATVREER